VYNKQLTAMKKLLLFAFILSVATINDGVAQEKTAPRTEYSVSLSENIVKLTAGETKQLTVSILKSKQYSKSKVKLGLSSTLPEGVTITFEPAEGIFDSSVASIAVADNVKEGEYQIIIKSTVNNKIKGSIVKVVVSGVSKEAITAN
jgi:hypothetical protein